MREQLLPGRHADKYAIHDSRLPIRLPPYLRRGLRNGDPMANMQLSMIKNDPCIGTRSESDTLPTNMQENMRLRIIARHVSQELALVAEGLQADSYCTIVHGSLSKGLVRNPSNPDRSDVDIDLVVNGVRISKEQKMLIRKGLYENSDRYGARIDTYVFNIDDLKRNAGENARIYLRSAAYPIANKNNLWERIVSLGLECQYFMELQPTLRRRIRRILTLIAEGNPEEILGRTLSTYKSRKAFDYLSERGISLGKNGADLQERSRELLTLVSNRG